MSVKRHDEVKSMLEENEIIGSICTGLAFILMFLLLLQVIQSAVLIVVGWVVVGILLLIAGFSTIDFDFLA